MGCASSRPPCWAILGTALFVVLVPGTVVVGLPYVLTYGWQVGPPLAGVPAVRVVGVLLTLGGAIVFMDFVTRFVWEGHGTPAPIAPTRHLVVRGPFRWVRNPGYVAVVTMLLGQALLFGSVRLLAYAAAVAVAFHVFVVYYEEPALHEQFGDEFGEYCRRVPRWLPRRPRLPGPEKSR